MPAVFARCEGDTALTTQVLRSASSLRTDQIVDALVNDVGVDLESDELRDLRPLSRDRDALIAAHVPARPARQPVSGDVDSLLASLPPIDERAPQSLSASLSELATEGSSVLTPVEVGRDE